MLLEDFVIGATIDCARLIVRRGLKLIILPLPGYDLALRHQLLRGNLYLTPARVPVTLYARAALAVGDTLVTVSTTGGRSSRCNSGDQQAGEDKDHEFRHFGGLIADTRVTV